MLINVVRPIPPQAVSFVQQREGLRLTAYPDPATGREPYTIGYGSAHGVTPGMTITLAEAVTRLMGDLQSAGGRIESHIGDVVSDLTDNMYSALLSFTLNLGGGPPKGDKDEWQIWRLLRARQYAQAADQFSRFNKAGGKVWADLVRRRADEQVLFMTGAPNVAEGALPSHVTQAVETPPTPVYVKPTSKSKTWWASWTSVGLTSGAALLQPDPVTHHSALQGHLDGAIAAIAPYVGQSTILQSLSSHLALVAAAAALAVPALLWVKNREAKSL